MRCLLTLGLLLLAGCSRDVPITTTFEDIGGLRPGDKVYLAEREVGAVEDIDVVAGAPGFIVAIELFPAHAELVQSNAVAYVASSGPPGVMLLNPVAPAPPVAAGGRLAGLSPLEAALWQASDAMEAASGLIDRFSQRVRDYFESEEWAQTRAQIDAEIAALAASSERAAAALTEELRRLFESLQSGAEAAPGAVRDEIASLQAEIDALEAEGHTELAASLRRLLERIEDMASTAPEAGTTP